MEQPPSYEDILRYPTMPAVSGGGSDGNVTQQYMQQHYQQQQHHQRQQQQQPRHQNHRRPKLGEVPLYEDSTERRRISELADLFAIIKATECLEAAYTRDAVSSSTYTEACTRLLSHFKSTEAALVSAGSIVSAESFISDFQVDCPRAYDRLLRAGVPATTLHGGGGAVAGGGQSESMVVAEIVQAFITAIDALALESYAIDTVQPLLADLMSALTRSSGESGGGGIGLPADFEALVKLRLWLARLAKMRAYEELSAEEARQLKFDLEASYQAFMRHLSSPPS